MKQQVAIYMRLSQEDVDKRTNRIKDESNSISAQRLLITRHLDLNPQLCSLPRLEFCDDGYTGTSFERPEFSRMIELVKREKSAVSWSRTCPDLAETIWRWGTIWNTYSPSSASVLRRSMTTTTASSILGKPLE